MLKGILVCANWCLLAWFAQILLSNVNYGRVGFVYLWSPSVLLLGHVHIMCLICWHLCHWLGRPKYVILWKMNVLFGLFESTKEILTYFGSLEMSEISMATMGPIDLFVYESTGSILSTFLKLFSIVVRSFVLPSISLMYENCTLNVYKKKWISFQRCLD